MEPDPLVELLEIARDLRTQLEWQLQSGALGLPRSTAEDIARWFPPLATSEAASPSAVSVSERAAPQSSTAALAPAITAPPNARALGGSAASSAVAPAAATASPASAPGAATPLVAAAPPLVAAGLSCAERARAPEILQRLRVLNEQAQSCTRCGLHAERRQAVFARGDGSSGVCFVGEGPGADEDAQGYPFVGAAGQLLDRMIEAMGLSRDEVYVCNIVKCRPPKNRKPEPEEMAACLPFLQEQIELLQPAVLVALGATAVQGLLGTSEGITRLRGKWKLYRGRVPVMPTFHPAYLLRTPGAKREVWEDLQAVLRQLGRAVPERRR